MTQNFLTPLTSRVLTTAKTSDIPPETGKLLKCKEGTILEKFWIFVRKGFTQRLSASPGMMWPVAESHEKATQLLQHYGWDKQGIRVARIGSVEGETLQGHIRIAMEDGCLGVCCFDGLDNQGQPTWKYLLFD